MCRRLGLNKLASQPKSVVPAQALRKQKKIAAISGSWICYAKCNAAFPAGDLFSISKHLSGTLQLVGTGGGKLRSVHAIRPSETSENSYAIDITNTSPPTTIDAVLNVAEKTLSIEDDKDLILVPAVK